MEMNIIVSGVGGMGVLTAARILAESAFKDGFKVIIGELHGMSQRGGSVRCDVRIGDVRGAIVPTGKCDLMIGLEPLEVARSSYKMKRDGKVLVNNYAVYPSSIKTSDYPKIDEVKKIILKFAREVITINAYNIALKAGSASSMNVVMIGAAEGLNVLRIRESTIKEVIREMFSGDYQKINMRAFEYGLRYFR
ncbi:MAG: indolepyruvate oxidoreductase subunit beta [Candidatus Asgardarchaeia archaeon]